MRYKSKAELTRRDFETFGFDNAIKQTKIMMVNRATEKLIDELDTWVNFDIKFSEGWEMSMQKYFVEMEVSVIR